MDLYQHFRQEEYPFIDQVLSWREEVTNRYESRLTDFLHPREQRIFKSLIGNDETLKLDFFGAWEDAERKRAILTPFYEEITTESFEVELLQAKFPEKFVSIEHRDVLGAFLSAGIHRKKIGDIIINDGYIQILVAKDITTYLTTNVTSIKKANVQFDNVSFSQLLDSTNRWIESTATCSSLRLDVLIKEMYQTSRQQALDLIKKGFVKVNFQTIEQAAFLLEEGDLLSVRGKGRTRLKELQGKTKKDKVRIIFEKLN
ncbi:RNA-binding protein YlmH, contains S4-like domain [Gracilibacillus ureilyticus]|uniref:RNA-binding protein YlmH, contains S4-like domain n=1 Tax=Gracilibacillus ureilyticus TaxID=531814 RepID=A0A1H9KZ32_9BACI|nr:YlmH/Sll1252 family protein [Gracilibacillus ureilyticus]SER04420.1 RNA-binding protein YlmH, contains S4-like domain [Gracilibacillus ureilyticus]